jgi:hypothetical protein
MCSLDGRSGTNTVPFQGRDASKLGRIIEKDEGLSMRAVKGSLGRSPEERYREKVNTCNG